MPKIKKSQNIRTMLFGMLSGVLFFGGAFACATNEIDALGDGTQCETTKFSVTTTSDATTLDWQISAAGEFYVDCGDGGTLTQSGTTTGSTLSGNTITRTGTGNTTYICTWGSAGTHTIKFAGTATGYSTAAAISFYRYNGAMYLVASISGSLGAMFPVVNGNIPRFKETFYGCSNLTSLPADLFSGIGTSSATDTSNMFDYTFRGTGITGIPVGLFGGIDTSSATNTSEMFRGTFHSCTSLRSLPADLFSTIDTSSATDTSSMFLNTFYGCTSLTSLPAGLFSAIDTSSATNTRYMFDDTFYNCTSLTSIPADLFSSIDTSSATDTRTMFQSTFSGCTSLTSIPAGLFSGVDTSNATDTSYMFSGTFVRTGITSIPAGLFSGIDTSSVTDTSRMFQSTFNGCSNLGGYIPPTTFPGTIQPGSSSTNMWYRTFYNTQLLTACPAGTTQYTTGFESDWDGKVSCEPCPGTLPEHASYTTAGTCDWACDSGYMNTGTSCEMACTDGVMYNGECRAYCPVMRTLHVGDVEYPIFADRTGVSPVFNLRNGNTTCYLYLEPGQESGSLTTEYDSTVYHVFKPQEDTSGDTGGE